MYSDELVIRKIIDKDMPRLWELIFKEEEPEYKNGMLHIIYMKQFLMKHFW